ncbi:flavin reductase family protein, partial [Leucobacter soli]
MSDAVRMNPDGSVNVMEYRRTLGAFMTGVTVVTTTDGEGRPRGMTMNSFTSVSLDPPLVLVCVDHRAASYDAFVESAGIAVHILGSEQQDLARTFASKSEDKFADVETVDGRGGAPVIPDVHAWIDCATDQVVIAGDHAIIIGRVLDYDAQDRRPLGFYQGKFNAFSTDEEIVQQRGDASAQTTVRWVVETADGRLAVRAADDGSLALPESRLSAEQLSHGGLSTAAAARLGCDVEIDFLYSVYDSAQGNPILVYRGRAPGGLGDATA